MQSPTKSILVITTKPFKSSYLSISPSPCTPDTPLEFSSHLFPFRDNMTSNSTNEHDAREVPPPPRKWSWRCHRCHRTYSLGVTRRCLEDGHYFCAGFTKVRTGRRSVSVGGKMQKHRPCSSEFDYVGWKAWGRWRRSVHGDFIHGIASSFSLFAGDDTKTHIDTEATHSSHTTCHADTMAKKKQKNCWISCNYPSECGRGRLDGIQTPVVTNFSSSTIEMTPPPPPSMPLMTPMLSAFTAFENTLKSENCKEANKEKKDRKNVLDSLVARATRRKSVQSNLSLAMVDETGSEVDKDADDNVVMTTSSSVRPDAPKTGSTATHSGKAIFSFDQGHTEEVSGQSV